MRIIYIFFLFVLLLTGSCKKEPLEPQLPPLTQEGKNILACKINGEIFIAEGKIDWNTFTPRGVNYQFTSDSMINISAKEDEPFEANLSIEFIYQPNINNYTLNHQYRYTDWINKNVENYIFADSDFYTDSINTGIVNIAYFKNNIIAGTFEFDAIDTRGEVVHVTEGRF
jgi:hypothetical protein